MRIVIAGPGALGLLFAGYLSDNNDVTLLHHDRSAAKVLDKQGFDVTDGRASHYMLPCGVTVPERADLLLVSFKTWSYSGALEAMGRCDARAVLTVQNGIGNMERLAKVFGKNRVYGASVTYGVTRESATSVRVMGHGSVEAGAFGAGEMTGGIVKILEEGGFNARAADDIRRTVWLKAGVNMCINPVACIYDVANGELLDIPRVPELWRNIAGDVSLAAATDGIDIAPEQLAERARQVAQQTSQNVCSMLQDIRAGRRTEIDSICGEVIRRSKENCFSAKTCEDLYRSVKELERT
ncbi:MAG: 2-dehydropantoate 2-reductase [Planctomycetota bacterium]|nr:2-dehydropantoate 2-reductase [Planctomycetota bacterium]